MSPVSAIEPMAYQQDQQTSLGSEKYFQVPRPVVKGEENVVAFFGPGVECVGEIWYEGNVQIEGRLEGHVHSQGSLVIGDQAVVKATIEVGTIVCKGDVQGDVIAREKIQLLAPGSISGTLTTPRLSVETGGMINGPVSMLHLHDATQVEGQSIPAIREVNE